MGTNTFKPWLAALLIGAAVSAAQAQTDTAPQRPWRLVGSLGYSFGGDKIVSGTYANNGGSYSIDAGKGFELMAGAEYQINPKWSARATVGWQSDSTDATNGEFKFQRYPMELVGLYDVNTFWRVGAGVHRANSPKFTSSGVVSGVGSWEYKPSTGLALVGQYLFAPLSGDKKVKTAFEARYVTEKFTRENTKTSVKGDHLSLAVVVMY